MGSLPGLWCTGCSFLYRRVLLYKETKSMSEYQEPIQVSSTATPRWVGIALAVLAGVSLLGIGIGWSALNHANSVEQATQTSVKQANDALAQKLAKDNADDVNRINTDVNVLRTDLDTTKNNLQMARSEMGTLIARNHDEIDQLRRVGTRDYYEFTVTRKAGAQKVGAVQVELKSTNQKRNQFTINVLADDRTFEKKNRSVNEPIFFYTSGSRAALELVINKVTKSAATGYLSAPKAQGTTAASASTSGQ